MTKQQPTDKDGYAVLKTNKRSIISTIDIHKEGGYRTGWNNTFDRSQKPASERLTDKAKQILKDAETK
jgi:hypothetical protein